MNPILSSILQMEVSTEKVFGEVMPKDLPSVKKLIQDAQRERVQHSIESRVKETDYQLLTYWCIY